MYVLEWLIHDDAEYHVQAQTEDDLNYDLLCCMYIYVVVL
jgi:uncharacterized Tic20 family protein